VSHPGLCNNDRVIDDEEKPVLTGLAALLAVAVVVGLLLGLVALVGSQVLGLGDDEATSAGASDGATLYLPEPVPTQSDTGALITLAPGEPTPTQTQVPTQTPTVTKKPKKEISLSAGETSVAPMQQIDLTGTYPMGEGAILQVQRKEDGKWQNFYSIAANVSGGTFSTYVQTSHPGPNEFRVIDTDTGLTSNSVKVTVQ